MPCDKRTSLECHFEFQITLNISLQFFLHFVRRKAPSRENLAADSCLWLRISEDLLRQLLQCNVDTIILYLLLHQIYKFVCRFELKVYGNAQQVMFQQIQHLRPFSHWNFSRGFTVFAFKTGS